MTNLIVWVVDEKLEDGTQKRDMNGEGYGGVTQLLTGKGGRSNG